MQYQKATKRLMFKRFVYWMLLKREVEMDNQKLYEIAVSFRKAILLMIRDRTYFDKKDRIQYFPRGCCDDSADLLGYYLMIEHQIKSKQMKGIYMSSDPWNRTYHAWTQLENGVIIDITADQFLSLSECPDGVYVGMPNEFYNSLDDLEVYDHCNIIYNTRLSHDYEEILRYL